MPAPSKLDPYVEAQLRQFGRDLDANYQLHCNAIVLHARERLFRDLTEMNRPPDPKPRLWPLRAASKLGTATIGILRRFHRPVPGDTTVDTIIVIESPANSDSLSIYRPTWTPKPENQTEGK